MMMASSIFKLVLSSFLLCTLFHQPTNALRKTHIVYLGAHSHGPDPSFDDLETATNSHYDLLGEVLGSHEKVKETIMYSYNKHINGFAALLEEEEASEIAKKPNIVSVFVSKKLKLDTTRSWDFLGLEKNGKIPANSAWRRARFGENTIIGNIDTGVWPEHPSFRDKGYGPVPSKWRGKHCEIDQFSNPKKSFCNRKLIGARIFSENFEAEVGKLHPLNRTARDFEGHGTHTLSTAGGEFVPGANIFGNGKGTAKGGSPKARVVAYKACWNYMNEEGGCNEADMLKAFDEAIYDGVDVISASISGYDPYAEGLFTDAISIGAFHAIVRNIVVVTAAGNEGPDPGTVKNVAPWSFTVAASTIDRDFLANISLGGKHYLNGASLNVGLPSRKFYPVVLSVDAKLPTAAIEDARRCKANTLNPSLVTGKILICLRSGKINSIGQGQQAAQAGATGVFVQNDNSDGNTLLAEPHNIAAASIQVDGRRDPNADDHSNGIHSGNPNASRALSAYMTVARTYLGRRPAPIMAGFSSRGPSVIQPLILKPDVTGPGVNILAAYSQATGPSNLPTDTRRVLFNVQQGTSMSCPHVAGIAGLLKTLHPDWSPAAIKSAIMTTATTLDNTNRRIHDAFGKEATPFEYGSGHVRPDLAIDPGLVYDLSPTDYKNFLCASGYQKVLLRVYYHITTCPKSYNIEDLNYPSISVRRVGPKPVTVKRTVTNVGPPGTYNVSHVLKGFKVVVQPSSLTFTKIKEKKTYRVILQAKGVPRDNIAVFGSLTWTDGKHNVTSPIVVLQMTSPA